MTISVPKINENTSTKWLSDFIHHFKQAIYSLNSTQDTHFVHNSYGMEATYLQNNNKLQNFTSTNLECKSHITIHNHFHI